MFSLLFRTSSAFSRFTPPWRDYSITLICVCLVCRRAPFITGERPETIYATSLKQCIILETGRGKEGGHEGENSTAKQGLFFTCPGHCTVHSTVSHWIELGSLALSDWLGAHTPPECVCAKNTAQRGYRNRMGLGNVIASNAGQDPETSRKKCRCFFYLWRFKQRSSSH